MKKVHVLTALLLVLAMAFSMIAAGCSSEENNTTPTPDTTSTEPSVEPTNAETDEPSTEPSEEGNEPGGDEVTVMTHAEYMAADLDSEVTIETYVQAKQSWWQDQGTFYCQSEDGAYFLYNMGCSEDEYNQLTPGTKIRVTGFKSEWSGEVEIIDATWEIIDGSFTATATDVTSLLGTDELIDHQNEFVSFKGMTVKAIQYKNDEPGDDIYVTLGYGEDTYEFCVEAYLTGPDTDVYAAVGALNEGDTVDLEGFLYWYEGPNTHITAVSVVG